MKALSFRQPWAELILQGRKTIDLRTWPTTYRGPLVIHASQQVDPEICALYGLDPASLARGALVGRVDVVEMLPLDSGQWDALRDQHLKPGPFPGDLLGWRLTNPQRLSPPIPLKGRLGLFNIPDELIDRRSNFKFDPPQPPVPLQPSAFSPPPSSFELRVLPQPGNNDYSLALYQWPLPGQPSTVGQSNGSGHRPPQPDRLADLAGDALRAVADHILAALRQNGYKPTDLSATRRKPFYLDEETGLRLGLLFLTLKPLARPDRIEAISAALRIMPSEEAYYWFSKCTAAASAVNAQRALRMLLAGE